MDKYKIYFLFFIIIELNIFSLITGSFQGIEKISDNDNFLVVLDNGFYIYDFENSKCEKVKDIDQSEFKGIDENNPIIISKNYNSISKELKIAILINQHLYIYEYNNKMINYIKVESISNENIYPFYVEIDSYKLKIKLIEKSLMYYIKSFDFENYLSIKNSEPTKNSYEDDYSNKLQCQADTYNSLIKCIYPYGWFGYLKFRGIDRDNKFIDTYVEKKSGYKNIDFTFSKNTDFVCTSKNGKTLCFYKKAPNNEFTSISYNFNNDCSELKTFCFEENNEFILSCKKLSNYYLYIFNENDMKNNIQTKTISNNYNGKYSIIYSRKKNNYVFISDNNFIISCDEYNQMNDLFSDNQELNEIQDINNNENNITYISDTNKTEELEEEQEEEKIINIEEEIFDKAKIIIGSDIIEKVNMTLTKELILDKDNIKNMIAGIDIGKNIKIKGKDISIEIKPTNSTAFQNSTRVDFDECEQLLKNKYNYSNSTTLTFFKVEFEDDENKYALYNQIKYFVFDENKEILNLSLCEDINIPIHYAIKEDVKLDIEKINKFKNKGVDIFNIKDEFFNDLCKAYSESNNDMILKDRINYIYQNYSLCEEGCDYDKIDLNYMSIICNCKIQDNFSSIITPLEFGQANEVSFFDSNIGIAKCYEVVFTLKNKIKNIGFMLFTFLLLIYIIFFFIFLFQGIKPIYNFIINEMKKYGYLKNKENKENKENTIINKLIKKEGKNKKHRHKKNIRTIKKNKKNMIDLNIGKSEVKENIKKDSIFTKLKNKKEIKINNNETKNKDNEDEIYNFGIIKININDNIKKYYPKDSAQSLHNYTFKEAIKYDRRNIFRIFYIYLLSKQIIFRTFFQKSLLELFSLRFTLFIFMLSCDLALNSLFYLNDNISKKYHYTKNLFLFAFSNNMTIIIYSTLLSYFLITLMNKLTNSSNAIRNIFRKEESKLKSKNKYKITQQRKDEIYKDVLNILKKLKIKIFFYFFIEIIFLLFFWYFVTAFCHIYSNTQTSWLFDGFLSILSRFILELIIAFLYAKLYQISVGSNFETMYKIVICIYDFS